jgi:hypothetical protein
VVDMLCQGQMEGAHVSCCWFWWMFHIIVFEGERVWMSCLREQTMGSKYKRYWNHGKMIAKLIASCWMKGSKRGDGELFCYCDVFWIVKTNQNLRREQGNGVWNLNELVEQIRSGWCSFGSATVSMCQELQPWWTMGCLPSKSVIILC